LVKPGQTYFGAQGILYSAGASKETVGAQKICTNAAGRVEGVSNGQNQSF